jgi:hypothetical protein
MPYFPAGGTGFGGSGAYSSNDADSINDCAASANACVRLAQFELFRFGETLDPIPFFARPPIMPRFPFPRDLTRPPGPGWVWRGRGPPGSRQGNWLNRDTGEWLHNDMNHPEPIGPHLDYRAPDGSMWRWFPNGTWEPKGIVI